MGHMMCLLRYIRCAWHWNAGNTEDPPAIERIPNHTGCSKPEAGNTEE